VKPLQVNALVPTPPLVQRLNKLNIKANVLNVRGYTLLVGYFLELLHYALLLFTCLDGVVGEMLWGWTQVQTLYLLVTSVGLPA
jgi:hypothetical protein